MNYQNLGGEKEVKNLVKLIVFFFFHFKISEQKLLVREYNFVLIFVHGVPK